MAVSVTGRMLCTFTADLVNALTNSVASTEASLSLSKNIPLADGTTANKANQAWASYARTLTSGNNEEIDLYDLGSLDIGAGAGKDPVGGAFALAEIVGLLIISDAASVGVVTVGGTTASTGNEWVSFLADKTDLAKIRPGGFLAIGAGTDPGWAVVDSTNHKLKIAAVGGNVTYSIFVLGRNA